MQASVRSGAAGGGRARGDVCASGWLSGFGPLGGLDWVVARSIAFGLAEAKLARGFRAPRGEPVTWSSVEGLTERGVTRAAH
jgi:hypothetical protein